MVNTWAKHVGLLLLGILSLGAVTPRSFVVIDSLPHHKQSFTQGLIFHQNRLVESTGSSGRGTMILVLDPTTGKELKKTPVDNSYFGEGLATDGRLLYQLSWQSGFIQLFSWPSLSPMGRIPLKGEGWGLTFAKDTFYLSNGSDTLFLMDKQLSKVLKKRAVTYKGKPLDNLNELEYIQGKIFANRWYSDTIFVIDPTNGMVEQTINCASLVKKQKTLPEGSVLNGIAWDGKKLYVTGKYWPKIYILTLK